MIRGNIPSISKHDESTRHWFVFGVHSATGRVDLCDGTNDVAEDLHPDDAALLIQARDRFIEEVQRIAHGFKTK